MHSKARDTEALLWAEALGLEFRRDMDIVRNGEKEATNYFFGVPGQEEELELTLNHDAARTTSEPGMATSHSRSTISIKR